MALINGDRGPNSLFGTPLDDTINGFGDQDGLWGREGDDTLNGGDGDDNIYGEVGNDVLNGDSGDDFILGGNVYFIGTVPLPSGNDTLSGGDGNDFLHGQDGRDSLSGGFGNDTIVGGVGEDTLIGGSGVDTFRFESSSVQGVDQTDFNIADDFIEIKRYGFGATSNAVALNLGTLNSNRLVAGNSAPLGSPRQPLAGFRYNPVSGVLSFDSNGGGFVGSIDIATLDTNLPIDTLHERIFVT